MRLLIVRHAPAGNKAAFARTKKSDSQRPLTKTGREKMLAAASGLAQLLPPPELIASSPLLRARQTAEILFRFFPSSRRAVLDELSPGKEPKSLLRKLKTMGNSGTVAIVGHEPHLSRCADYLLTGGNGLRISLKKGACCLLEFSGRPQAAKAALLWSLAPAHLRRIAGKPPYQLPR